MNGERRADDCLSRESRQLRGAWGCRRQTTLPFCLSTGAVLLFLVLNGCSGGIDVRRAGDAVHATQRIREYERKLQAVPDRKLALLVDSRTADHIVFGIGEVSREKFTRVMTMKVDSEYNVYELDDVEDVWRRVK